MSLAKYKQKRRFNSTPEPAGKLNKKSDTKLAFVVQKHHATQLHYDFRLELDGVLKSWAVPKGPSLDPKVKRLAMMVEDHPYDYKDFEGVIPEGNYGAGNVIIWDKGWYELHREEPSWPASLQAGLKKGDLKFILHGQKLKGSFALIKTGRMGKSAWLLIKHRDQYATSDDITRQSKSVVSGRQVDDVAGSSKIDLSSMPKVALPRRIKPMLATLVDQPFDDPDWLFEIKWDGYRAIASWEGQKTELYSRNLIDFSERYAPVAEGLREFKHEVVVDGEIVVLDQDGRSHFEWLQNWTRQPEGKLAYVVFDLLWCDGHDLHKQPLHIRKQLLQKIMPESSTILFSDHVTEHGKTFFKAAQSQRLEGIMAKNINSAYREGYRSKQWLKVKTNMRQEVVIGGFTEPRGSRKYIGSLLVGLYDNGKLIYAGHAGGLVPRDLKDLRDKLVKLEVTAPPFADNVKIKPNAPVHWVSPKLVGEVTFTEWTSDRRMRHPIFIGLRPDKKTTQVRKEVPEPTMAKPESKHKKPARLEFTHLDKVFFADSKITKGDLIAYYESVAETMMPYLKHRPHSLLRQPNGIDGESFFQKDVDHMPPDWVQTKAIFSESNNKDINYLVCNSTDSLLYMVQLGCIEINPWNSTTKHLEKPDWLVIDLDPEGIGFDKVIKTAQVVHQLCQSLKVQAYPKTSGKTGIHIYIPLAAKYSYDQTKQLAEILANLVQQRLPDFTSVLRLPSKRKSKIYVDFLQNRKGQTLAAPYSVRPTPVASVSTPLHWDEVKPGLDPAKFTIKNTPKRLKRIGDLWRPVLGKGIDIKNILSKLE